MLWSVALNTGNILYRRIFIIAIEDIYTYEQYYWNIKFKLNKFTSNGNVLISLYGNDSRAHTAQCLLCVHGRWVEGRNGVPVLHAQVIRERVDDVLDPDHVLHGTESE